MRTLFFILCLWGFSNLAGQTVQPFLDIKTFLDFNLPHEDIQEGAPLTDLKQQASLSLDFITDNCTECKELVIGVGPTTNSSTYLLKNVLNPIELGGSTLHLNEVIKFSAPLDEIWLTVRMRYNNGSLSEKSFIKIK